MSRSRKRYHQAFHCVAGVRWTVVSLALALAVSPFFFSQAFAQDDVGVPMHPKAVPSSIVRQSGEGEGTRWITLHFTVNAPYRPVVTFYRDKVGKDAQISRVDSEKLLNTLILVGKDPADQLNINISSEVGGRITRVELSRNVAHR
ncbi:MAG: hypothetical protein C3F08_09680 [Candidatus Methylomirabilota bacterium]|nr:MAG: hypothetical protein C3F08_09680 [candidate division NC10 bacterium]